MVSQTTPKTIAILAYCTLIGRIIAMVLDKERSSLARFHIRQGLGIYLLFILSGMLFIIPFFGWILGLSLRLLLFVLWLIGLLDAVAEKEKPVPIFGEYFQNLFSSL